jgi:hypothetical protein
VANFDVSQVRRFWTPEAFHLLWREFLMPDFSGYYVIFDASLPQQMEFMGLLSEAKINI